MTQLIKARKGEITPEMEYVAKEEGINVNDLMASIAAGEVVILKNKVRKNGKPLGIGKGLKTKVNASIGTSNDHKNMEEELEKLKTAEKAGANTIMDLSSGGDIVGMRQQTLSNTELPIGSVPLYEASRIGIEKYGTFLNTTADDIFEVIERQAQDGIDFMAIHVAYNMEVIKRLKDQGRVTNVVSRGGSFLTGWMLHNNIENPLYEQFDRVLEIAKKYDVCLSVGDAIRPGCIADSMDRAQMQGLILVGELVQRALEAGVQVMVEGPGHVPANQIPATVLLQKQLCHGVPYFLLGNLVTDIAPGYDHITAAIGGTIAAMSGADFICYVTPAEHLRLPTKEDVHEGVIATRIATHAADIVKGVKGAWEWDLEMSKARQDLDWETQLNLAIDPERARKIFSSRNLEMGRKCSMCGDLCALRIASDYLNDK